MTDGDALLREIIASPGDDLLRLIYADWLDEAGEAERAALIRVQIALTHKRTRDLLTTEQQLLGPVGDRVWQRRREWALPASVQLRWPTDVGGWEWHRGFSEVWHCPLTLWELHGATLVAARPVRRVVLIDREPHASVLNPRSPRRSWFCDDAEWVQPPEENCLLPPVLFDLLEQDALDLAMFDHTRTYSSRADALAALSDACISLAVGRGFEAVRE
ncbi:MAG: TIGR02996 domain-containing protein [Planctomycetes bacterium]|nr:TIGR02996 domain-containing protein [Planctomycetota bacterium]